MNMNKPISMLDVIRCARPHTKPCPFCGEDPPLAGLPVAGRYVVGCETDGCPGYGCAYGSTLAEAWAKWNRRAI